MDLSDRVPCFSSRCSVWNQYDFCGVSPDQIRKAAHVALGIRRREFASDCRETHDDRRPGAGLPRLGFRVFADIADDRQRAVDLGFFAIVVPPLNDAERPSTDL